MPRRLRLEGLQAELASLGALLRNAKEMGDPVGEYQLSRRRKLIEESIRMLLAEKEKRASVALFFGGKPVLGSRGISAEFAGHMLEYFQDLVTRTFASVELGVLGERGPAPMKEATTLMVTHLTKGSFGFVLDELSDQNEIEDTVLKKMVEQVVMTVEKVASANELDFEEVSEKLDARLLISLKDFFSELDNAQATMRLVDDDVDISLDQSAVRRGRLRTEATSIDEADLTLEGVLEGFLPEHKKFELRVNPLEVVYGSVAREAAEQYTQMVSTGDNPVRQTWRVRISRRTVTPLNRPARQVNRLMEFLGKQNA